MQRYHELDAFNGAVLVAEGGRVLYEDAFGPAVLEFGVESSLETRFRIASISKPMTVVLVMQLVEEGMLDLDEPIGRYLETVREDISTRVTTRQLLNHTSGLGREYLPNEDIDRAYALGDLVAGINENVEFVGEPGAASTYSNAGYVLLAAIVETLRGRLFEDVLRVRLFGPAGMVSAGLEVEPSRSVERLSRGYRLRFGTHVSADRVNMSTMRGNGGVYATVRDLYLFERAMRDDTLLSSASREAVFTPELGRYGFAWQIRENQSGFPEGVHRLAWHRGANRGGFRTQLTMQLDGDRVVVLLANLDDSPRLEITQKLFELMVYGETTLPTPSLAHRAMSRLRAEGVAGAASMLREEPEADAGGAINEILGFGHHAIRAGAFDEAVAAFELCDEMFPGIAVIVVSRAYGYLRAGRLDEARVHAERALELDPGNSDALEVLAGVSPRY
ncbi:MAG: serine hydrolase [Planctomycetota bacterium]